MHLTYLKLLYKKIDWFYLKSYRENLPFHPLVHYPDVQNDELGYSDAGSKELVLGYSRECRKQKTWTILCCFSRSYIGSWIANREARARTGAHLTCWHHRLRISLLYYYSHPKIAAFILSIIVYKGGIGWWHMFK